MDKPFRFKHFTVQQDRCAMKIGTDGVLLGAWASIPKHTQSILDIGAGTGILALMMAQRSPALTIDAVETDANAYEQCVDNFEDSPWNDRLFCYHADFIEFVDEMEDEEYDFILSNPPFFDSFSKDDSVRNSRQMARFTDSLSLEELAEGVDFLLSDNGQFVVILPYNRKDEFISLAGEFQLYPIRITDVRGNPETAFKRSLLQFSRERGPVSTSELVIEIGRHEYTEEYKELTKDFYLNF